MLRAGTKVRTKRNSRPYVIIKLWPSFAEIIPLEPTWLEEIANLSKYVDIDDIEEWVDDRIDRPKT